ncbi:MAG: T9SS type A sorting domain-containing protein, partial [Flavobacterium sp.]|nr:T9SS type A sorting domain-containing protein [Flavobacterium sp.]
KLVPATVGTSTFASDKFTVSPNPVTDVLRISNNENINFTAIQVTDINGRIVKSLNLNNVTSSQINVADLNAGIYFLNITSDAGKAVKKFIKN